VQENESMMSEIKPIALYNQVFGRQPQLPLQRL
jgi:hypothetical protein